MRLPFNIHLQATTVGYAMDLTDDCTSINWTISDQFGFESMDIQLTATVESALTWFTQLGADCAVYSMDADTCWNGYLNEVSAVIGGETHSRSLDALANRIRVRYTTVLGSPAVTATTSDTTSIARYFTKDYVERIGEMTSTAAVALSTRILNDRRWPGKQPSTTVQTGETGQITITLSFVGYYGMLDWLLTSNTTTTSAVTTTQTTDLITSYNGTNSIFSTTFTNVTASGLSDTQYIAPDTTYRAAIERLLLQGNSSGVRFAWGVYEDQTLWVQTWAGASPGNTTYRRSITGTITGNAGGSVPLWLLRPNAMVEISEFLDISPQSNEVDAAARYYVARTTFRADSNGMQATLEPTDIDDITAQLARLNRG